MHLPESRPAIGSMKPLTLSRRRALLTGLLLLPGIGFLIVVFTLVGSL